ncbi:Beta-galactosidase (Lactase) [Pseudogymnoascus verrucosus]|uniref:beta-galactosidase n=1 Tax=Pseudogymnoascus verrucosus TaxID=342668 RepID=A0A1B8GV11_9PEZI|nr:Beta-galactosidase (Lactase) [Pseudogymnoascus verrucosus]OBT99681.1 Beta-galactosidase (Lactase) [Pseudogymnoascus verrucosus]
MAGIFPASKPDWDNIEIIHRGTLPPRSSFFVYDSYAHAISQDTNFSCSVKLSGTWKFHHCYNPFDAPPGIEQPSFDISQLADIQVPGLWQLQGWANPHYSNVNYIIPVDPPNVPYQGNQTGSYVRKFTVPEGFAGDQLRLRFEGVDSAFHVYVNGHAIGYSQGARNPSEFDITSAVVPGGENTLAVIVYQYCDGSYLEDQDQWRLSGIFRDVFLLAFPKPHIRDFHVQTLLDADYKDADLNVTVDVDGDGPINLTLIDHDGQTVVTLSKQASDGASVKFEAAIIEPRKWSAEDPQLYKLILEFGGRFLAKNVGFRKVEMKEGIYTINGKRIVFRGVNRHEHHPVHGRSVPYEFMKNDLLTMKRCNINSIRTCHQPSDPRLYDLADELGFWIIDEADVECHGFATIDRAALTEEEKKKSFHERIELVYGTSARWTSDNPEWKAQYVDRAVQLCARDKNSPSVVMWSLGNEAFYGCNFQSMYDEIKAIDESRPIHYEGDRETKSADIWSQMYVHPDDLVEEIKNPKHNKSLILCEFAHAMGNGPGNLKEYMDAFYAHPRLQGGHVWEWSNQGLQTKDPSTGENFYAYGGDFGDVPNNPTFILDGLVSSDHTATPGLLEYRKAIEPVQVKSYEGQKVTIINRYDLISLNHLKCTAFIVGDGFKKSLGEIAIPMDIPPHTEESLLLPNLEIPEFDGESYLQLDFCLKSATIWADCGHLVASSQLLLRSFPVLATPTPVTAAPTLVTTHSTLNISTTTSDWTFSVTAGKLISWKKANIELIQDGLGPELGISRAMTDNDVKIDGVDWNDKFVFLSQPHTRSVSWETNDQTSSIEVVVHARLAPPVLSWSFSTTTTYTFRGDGTLHINCAGKPDDGLNLPLTMPRLGFTLGLVPMLDAVQWFGRGPGESYKDKKMSQLFGNWSASVDELFFDYDHPQETSNRTDVRWVKLGSNDGKVSLTAKFGAQDGFSFMASHYTSKDLEEAAHPFDLRRTKKDYVVLRLDEDHNGLGTGACGPKTLAQYALKPREFAFDIDLE